MMKLKATIKFTVDENHPDYEYISEEHRKNGLEFSDIYTFDVRTIPGNPMGYWNPDDYTGMCNYAKHDLALVAGGGYNTEHIHNVEYDLKWIDRTLE